MIRIRRGREPAALRPIRRVELTRTRIHHAAGTLDRNTLGNRYEIVRDNLCILQHYKCCYCERNNFEPSYNDVEHYRPKLSANRGAGFPTHGYWWLAWTWQNLMFACPNCNRSWKNDEFPLATGSIALIPEQRPNGTEIALLLDPCVENPVNHIKFTFHPGLPKNNWRPLPRSGSAKGDNTIRVLKLDRPSLLDLYDSHVNLFLLPILARLNVEIAANNLANVSAIWTNEVMTYLLPGRPFTAISYDAIDHYVPRSLRRRFVLPFSIPN